MNFVFGQLCSHEKRRIYMNYFMVIIISPLFISLYFETEALNLEYVVLSPKQIF